MLPERTTQPGLAQFSRCDHQDWLPEQEQAADNKTDSSIAGKVSRALWNGGMQLSTDSGEINVAVIDRTVFLSGHVNSVGNQQRALAAAQTIPGVQDVKNYLVSDDNLLRNLAGVLGKIEHSYGVKFFFSAQNGVIVLNGEAGSAAVRSLAEKNAASVPGVRGVMNSLRAPEVNVQAEDPRFLQPNIGVKIYFSDGLFGIVRKVVLNPNNLRVIAMIIQEEFSRSDQDPRFLTYSENHSPGRLAVISISHLRYLTERDGFLYIDSKDTGTHRDFEPSSYIAPEDDWMPPYPYCPDDIVFPG